MVEPRALARFPLSLHFKLPLARVKDEKEGIWCDQRPKIIVLAYSPPRYSCRGSLLRGSRVGNMKTRMRTSIYIVV